VEPARRPRAGVAARRPASRRLVGVASEWRPRHAGPRSGDHLRAVRCYPAPSERCADPRATLLPGAAWHGA